MTYFNDNCEKVLGMVERSVLCNVGELVGLVIKADENYEWEESWENTYKYVCPNCDSDDLEEDWEGDFCYLCDKREENCDCEDKDVGDDDFDYVCNGCGHVFDHPMEQYQDIYEYYAVSLWLMEKLRERGEPVRKGSPSIWGRGTTGQAIYLDGVIWEIARKAGLIPSQEEWERQQGVKAEVSL